MLYQQQVDVILTTRLAFVGSKEFGFRTAQILARFVAPSDFTIITLNDLDDGRSAYQQIRTFCDESGIKCVSANTSGQLKQTLKGLNPDLTVVNGWYYLIDKETLSLSKNGFIGIHNSLLPSYRGFAPLVWAIINGERKVGSSIFFISDGVDDGDLIDQVSVDVSSEDNVATITDKLQKLVLERIPVVVQGIVENTVRSRKQIGTPSYCGKRISRDGLVDWRKRASEVHDFIRAQTIPYPCAFTYLAGKPLRIVRSSLADMKYFGTPGQVLSIGKSSVLVACESGTALYLEDLLIDGQIVPASSVIKTLDTRFENLPDNRNS